MACLVPSCRFNWDEAKYPVMSPLRETVESIHETVAKLEDDLKVRLRGLLRGQSLAMLAGEAISSHGRGAFPESTGLGCCSRVTR